MANGMQSEFFESHVGLRLGENLSPLLFALFLNDMETFFTEQIWNTLKFIDKLYTDSHDEVTGMLNLFVLIMYADDTVIMAENEHDMQRNLNLLNYYCNCNKLKVNISKKKKVFARSKTRLNNIPTCKFGNIDLEQVEDYIYLGICFNWNGSFVKANKLLHDKASKAMYSLIQKGWYYA